MPGQHKRCKTGSANSIESRRDELTGSYRSFTYFFVWLFVGVFCFFVFFVCVCGFFFFLVVYCCCSFLVEKHFAGLCWQKKHEDI